MALLFRSGLTTVELALKNAILLAYGFRISPPFPTVASCRAFAGSQIRPDELCFITSKGVTYQFNRFSTAADDGDLVIAPTDSSASGRWLKTTNIVSTGYAKAVRVHAGDESYILMLKRANAARPSIHLIFDGLTFVNRSLSKGALYQCIAKYKIKCIASSLRGQAQAIEGSDIISETDPGTHNMVGDLIFLLAGSNLSNSSVGFCEIEEERYSESAEGGRLFVEHLALTVFYTIHSPDTDSVIIDSLSGLNIQRQLLGGGSAYDTSNQVTSGYTIPTGSGFVKTPVSGTAMVNGLAVSSSPVPFVFSANKDTYRDLHTDGTFTYTAVKNGAPPPLLSAGVGTGVVANSLRVGVTVTDGSGVIYDAMLAGTLTSFKPVDIVPGAGVSVTSIAITPVPASGASGSAVQFTCTATYSNGSTADVSTLVSWTSGTPTVATIDFKGRATLLIPGTSSISCTLDTLVSNNSTLTSS